MVRSLKLAALGLLIGLASAVTFGGCGSPTEPAPSALGTKTAAIGALEVKVTPIRLDATGADVTIVFDTHTGAPTIDVATNTTLTVNGTPWKTLAWTGDGPGGHHRQGRVSFEAAGPSTGTAVLTVTGLAQPVTFTWQLPPA